MKAEVGKRIKRLLRRMGVSDLQIIDGQQHIEELQQWVEQQLEKPTETPTSPRTSERAAMPIPTPLEPSRS